MGEALKALESASRRELQALAKKLQFCRGNAKSNVILSHAMQFMNDHPNDGEQQVLNALGGSGNAVSVTSPVATKLSLKKEDESRKQPEDESDKQPEDEPLTRVETKNLSAATNCVTLKDKDKSTSEHMLYDTATITSPLSAAPSAKSSEPNVTAVPLPNTSFATADKIQLTSVEIEKVDSRKKDSAATTKTAPISKNVEAKKARKAVEALVNSSADLTFIGESRVRCFTTGHEMLADVNIINTYLHGKRYQKACNLKLSFAKYAPMFVDHPDESKTDMLWCNVTDSAIARDEKRVNDHMTALKYQKQLSSWQKQEAAKKKAEEEENQRREARIQMAKRKRLEAAEEKDDDNAVVSERPIKRKRLSTNSDK